LNTLLYADTSLRSAYYNRRAVIFPRYLIIAIVLVVGAIIAIVAVASLGGTNNTTVCSVLGSNQKAPGIANSSSDASASSFIIVDSDPGSNYEGMNGSAFHLTTPWPVIQVHQGQTVTIRVFNCASSESHGFAITHYFDSGTAVRPGQSYTFTFVANEAGTFRIYCNIFCAIHPLMQNGQLIVTPS
jgi:FtsP/CotA-like multicopper oxidase with cupredoxin domain